MEKIYSNRIWKSVLGFIETRYGKEVADQALAATGVDRLALADPHGFQAKEFGEILMGKAESLTGAEDIAYQAGRNLPETMGAFGGFVVGLTSPSMFMKLMGSIESKMALKTVTHTERFGRNRYRVRVSFLDGFQENELACRNRVGSYESIPRFFGLPYAKVDHPKCVFRGDPQCEYLVQVPEYGFLIWKRLALALLLGGLLAGAMALGLDSLPLRWTALAGLLAGMGAYTYYKHRQADKSLAWTLLANETLAQHVRELDRDNAKIQGLQAITTALEESMRVADLCEEIVVGLVKNFKYGSSQIWLLDDARKFLVNRAAHGYSRDLEAFIRNTRFEMGRNWDNPYGLLVQTLEKGQTLIVNDVEETLAKLTSRTREFIQTLDPSSFIITPIFRGKEAVGILTAEHHGGLKLSNKDRLLFLSVSHVAGNALTKADLFEKMEEKIAQRTSQLEEASRQLVAAKEMAIQSEKLSSLGQMAAGVAHEINNPLNFLVNIIPDVRRDVEALEKIRHLALADGGGELAAKVRELDSAYDLETHLEEKDFVFERIRKALDKSTRIANSLKVFSRSSSKETVTWETFASMIQEVVDIIPQKVRGDTRIELDIPAGMGWNVNKNEMEQAFMALINNAIDAMGQKGRLRVEALTGKTELALAFKDEGPGIPPEALKRIFDPFYTTKPPGKGTGLGLTIASEIIRKYGGALSVASEPGKGSTFFIRFRKAAEDEAAGSAGPALAATG